MGTDKAEAVQCTLFAKSIEKNWRLYRRKDSRFWWINLVLPDGRRVCQSTGCVERTDAEAYVVRLKNEALEARQQGLLGIFVWQ